MAIEITPSLAGTGRDYAVIQVRPMGTSAKFQGRGPNSNRDYGVSTVVEIPGDLAKWLQGVTRTRKSLAGTDEMYATAQAAILDDERVRVQVSGTKLNRSYGAVFAVRDASLRKFVGLALEAAKAEADAAAAQAEAEAQAKSRRTSQVEMI